MPPATNAESAFDPPEDLLLLPFLLLSLRQQLLQKLGDCRPIAFLLPGFVAI